MSDSSDEQRLRFAAMLVFVFVAACIPARRSADVADQLNPTAAPPSLVPSPPAIPAEASAGVASKAWPAPTLMQVQVSVSGNLYIRRGPDLAFDPIGVLQSGQIAHPTGRDVLSRWLRVPLPAAPTRSGWISIMSRFTQVTGDIRQLPEIEPTDWPRLAFLRNCTYHQMMLEPAGIMIPSILYFPDNDVRINPGSYTVLDVDVDKYPEVLEVQIREGATVEIIVDGLGLKKKCPAR